MAVGITEGDKWQKDEESGDYLIPRRQSDYIDWIFENPSATAQQAADALEIPLRTLRAWRRDPRFKAEWKRRSEERMVDTARIQRVVDVLYNAAVNTADVKAATEYLKYIERFLPPRRPIEHDSEVEGMSDEQLAAEVASLLADDLEADWNDDLNLDGSSSSFEAEA
jgi:hypothetical protein